MPDQLDLFENAPGSLEVRATELFTDSSVEGVLTAAARIVRDVISSNWDARGPDPALHFSPEPVSSQPEVTSSQPEVEMSVPVVVETPLPPAPENSVLDTLDEVIQALKDGREISGMRERIARLVTNQENRAELIASLSMTHDFDRVSKFFRARASLEDILLTAACDRTLTPTQALAFLKLIQEQAEILVNRIRAGSTNIKDLMGLLNRADYALQLQDEQIQRKFANTSPQGREIIRRLTHRLHKITAGTTGSGGVQKDRLED